MNETEKQEMFERARVLLEQQLLDSLLEKGLNEEDARTLADELIALARSEGKRIREATEDKVGDGS